MVEEKNVLIVDDEIEVTSFFRYLFSNKNCAVTIANSGRDTSDLIRKTTFDLALLDIKLPDANGLDLLAQIKKMQPSCEVIMMTGYSTVKSAVTAMQTGARDYLEKPFDDIDRLEFLLEAALHRNATYEENLQQMAMKFGIVYAPMSPMSNVITLAAKLAKKAINILIEGETGTGKELFSRFIHGQSMRVDYPFIGINCGAISESLLESELFGHEKGAFTGAVKPRKGFFELANNGTLFLDEIGEAPLPIQVKLLRALETGEFMRVGSEAIMKSNVRIVAATNRNLESEVEQKRFRADLLYRIEGVKLAIPPLRERPQDVAVIAKHYLNNRYGIELHASAEEILMNYSWPGNVRQLLNILNQSVVIHECKTLRAEHLPGQLFADANLIRTISSFSKEQLIEEEIQKFIKTILEYFHSTDEIDFKNFTDRIKYIESEIAKKIIEKGLVETKGNRSKVCNKLNITPRILRYILNEK
ncbi:sigma-54 dependent transcriptional regulator [Fodinisporobacter ferrooxydans]|uniref:Sigma-54 dependent transcriptional regulator n=1 Tax=Fodinisporobacter ferrooxydans TaxID=2901836 RepID=A0ABY4CT78_9BACL|nr:sigma-54 dependent transcriptional regulator [Alicyclobacillaceae bacterium MYW30-H2]